MVLIPFLEHYAIRKCNIHVLQNNHIFFYNSNIYSKSTQYSVISEACIKVIILHISCNLLIYIYQAKWNS